MIYLLVKGLLRGFIREISSLAGIILGIWLGNLYQPRVTDLLRSYLPFTENIPLISFALIFAAILILFNLLGWIIKLLFKKIFLGWLDRTLGAGAQVAAMRPKQACRAATTRRFLDVSFFSTRFLAFDVRTGRGQIVCSTKLFSSAPSPISIILVDRTPME